MGVDNYGGGDIADVLKKNAGVGGDGEAELDKEPHQDDVTKPNDDNNRNNQDNADNTEMDNRVNPLTDSTVCHWLSHHLYNHHLQS